MDWNRQVNKVQFADGPNTFNFGVDFRYYYPIYRNFIWAGRAAADFSWGNQKMCYFLGGVDGWLMFGSADKFFNSSPAPAADQNYAFQSLAVESPDAVRTRWPSGLKAALTTPLPWPLKVSKFAPVVLSHNMAVPSLEAVTARFPLGLNAALQTPAL